MATAGGWLTRYRPREVRNSIYRYRKIHIDYRSKFLYRFISPISIIYGNTNYGAPVCTLMRDKTLWSTCLCSHERQTLWGTCLCSQERQTLWGTCLCSQERQTLWGTCLCSQERQTLWGTCLCSQKRHTLWGTHLSTVSVNWRVRYPSNGLVCCQVPIKWTGLLSGTHQMDWCAVRYPSNGLVCYQVPIKWTGLLSGTRQMDWSAVRYPSNGLVCYQVPIKWTGLLSGTRQMDWSAIRYPSNGLVCYQVRIKWTGLLSGTHQMDWSAIRYQPNHGTSESPEEVPNWKTHKPSPWLIWHTMYHCPLTEWRCDQVIPISLVDLAYNVSLPTDRVEM